MHDFLMLAMGGMFVVVGMLAAAVADRIRLRQPCAGATEPVIQQPQRRAAKSKSVEPASGSGEIVAALVGAGYAKTAAAKAVAACTPAEQATPESWVTAALGRCAGGVS